LSEQQIKRGAHRPVVELETVITAYIKIRNAASKPFRWTKSADDILASIDRFCRRTVDTQAKCTWELQNRDTTSHSRPSKEQDPFRFWGEPVPEEQGQTPSVLYPQSGARRWREIKSPSKLV
jgi:hypothetical protein